MTKETERQVVKALLVRLIEKFPIEMPNMGGIMGMLPEGMRSMIGGIDPKQFVLSQIDTMKPEMIEEVIQFAYDLVANVESQG